MKNMLLCFCFILFSTLFSFGQSAPQSESQFLEPQPGELIDQQVNVKRVHAKEFQVTPYGKKKDAGHLEFFEFDSLGHLVRQVEIKNDDTSRVRSLHYSHPGLLAWEQVDDKLLAKSYKAGYRLNPDRSVFQVKNYELLNAKSSMLLDTRMYRYNQAGKKQTVYSLTNNHLSESQHFSYDPQGRLVEEINKDAAGKMVRSIRYTYNEAGKRTRIEKTDFWIKERNEVFNYTYNELGKLLEILWEVDGKEKGRMIYEYDESGKSLQRISKTVDGKREYVKEFNYEFF